MRLRTLAILLFGALGVLAAVASVALVVATTALHRTTSQLFEAKQGSHATQELVTSLLIHSRENKLLLLTKGVEHVARRREARGGISEWLQEVRRHSNSKSEEHLLEQTELAINAYLDEVTMFDQDRKSMPATIDSLVIKTDAAIARLKELAKLNQEQGQEVYLEAARYDALANRFGIVVAVLVLLLILTIIFVLRNQVIRPIVAIDRAIMDFRARREVLPPVAMGAFELRNVSTAFKEMADDLKRQRQNLIRYIAAVAHDLRNPIGAIQMSAELIGHENALSSEGRQMLALLERQATYLNRLVGRSHGFGPWRGWSDRT